MNVAEVSTLVRASLKKHQEDSGPIFVVGVSSKPKDGQWQVTVEPGGREPSPLFRYYDMLSEVEEELAGQGLFVFLTPAPEADYHYDIDGETIKVTRREQTLFVSTEPWRGFSASYNPEGELLSGGAMSKDGPKLEGVPQDAMDRFGQAIQMYLEDKRDREEREQAITTYRR